MASSFLASATIRALDYAARSGGGSATTRALESVAHSGGGDEHGWSARALALAMAAHPRCGSATSPAVRDVASSPDLLSHIMRNVWLIVPDDAPTLVTALRRAVPWQRVLLRRGEHLVSAKTSSDPGSSQLRLRRPVEICGESGAILRGTLLIEKGCAGGAIRALRIDDGGDCCIRCEGGTWDLTGLRLRCSHGSALHVCGSAHIAMTDCVLGGEGDEEMGQNVTLSAYGSVQETGLHKRSCYAGTHTSPQHRLMYALVPVTLQSPPPYHPILLFAS